MRQVIIAFVVQVSLPYGPAARTGKALAGFLLRETLHKQTKIERLTLCQYHGQLIIQQ